MIAKNEFPKGLEEFSLFVIYVSKKGEWNKNETNTLHWVPWCLCLYILPVSRLKHSFILDTCSVPKLFATRGKSFTVCLLCTWNEKCAARKQNGEKKKRGFVARWLAVNFRVSCHDFMARLGVIMGEVTPLCPMGQTLGPRSHPFSPRVS